MQPECIATGTAGRKPSWWLGRRAQLHPPQLDR